MGIPLTLAALLACACSGPIPPLPDPRVDGFDPQVKDAVLEAHREAAARPDSGKAAGQLGMVLQAHAQYPQAAQAYRRAIRLEPDEFAWRYFLALTLEKTSKPDDALKTLSDALRKRSDYAPAMLKKGDLLFQLGRLGDATTAYESLLKQDSSSAAALYGLARVKYSQQDASSAEDLYRRAVQAFPNYGAAYYGLAVAGKALGREEEASKNFDLAKRFADEEPPAADPVLDQLTDLATGSYNRLQLAAQLLEKGDLEESARVNEDILKRDPENAGALMNLLFLARFLDRLDGQVDSLYERAVRVNPKVPYIHNHYGAVMLRQGRLDAATAALHKAIELKPDYAEAYTWLGEVLETQHRVPAAVEQYQRALAADPAYRAARIQLGRVLINLRRDREAIPALLPALQADDAQTSTVLVLLGEAYLYSGDRANARQYLEQARSRVRSQGPPQLLPEIDDELSQLGARP